jgi:FdhD protein
MLAFARRNESIEQDVRTMSRIAPQREVLRVTVGEPATHRRDTLAGEEPLELRVGGESLAVTMRTPGADFDLAAGFLVSEGVVSQKDELVAMRYCAGKGDDGINQFNVLDLTLAPSVAPPDESVARAFFTTSSCGLCGKASIDAVRTRSRFDVRDDPLKVSSQLLASLPTKLREAQQVFDKTGGLHAAGLFDARGELLALREDKLPLRETSLLVSGRASFELVQKAAMAGVPMLCAVSAPSSLAADLADESGITLVGFLRDPSMVVYAGADRVVDRD